jgi:hypothetical protein
MDLTYRFLRLQAVAFGRPVVSRAVTVNTQAFFGFGGSKPAAEGAAAQYYICKCCNHVHLLAA